ncbi:MAG: bifunctional folylpolyglutamate synthase/dihydrofolate synthase [Deltaproteobacteria bacterium]|nr:bifunctional folylpolyglutamate synthase/dihydrofolate synthase [Deltaproteobacteria bacterium]
MEAERFREWLFSLRRSGVHPSLAPTRSVLAALGHPDRGYRAVQVVGTVGKGSVSATLASLLQQEGRRVGLFTSPHLVHFEERMRVDGVDATSAELAEAYREIDAAAPWASDDPRLPGEAGRRGLTFFEWAVVLAARHFARKGCEVVVWEAGLGGRWDGTTAARADLTVISRIDLDHTRTLGETLEAIAAEKAEAFRPGAPVVSAPQAAAAAEVIARFAAERGCPLHRFGEDATLGAEGYREGEVFHPGLRPRLAGAHQAINAGVAILAARRLAALEGRPAPDAEALRRGLEETRWPGRLQWLEPSLLCDGFHNRAGAEASAAALPALLEGRPLHLVFGCLKDRDPLALLEPFLPLIRRLTLVSPVSERGLDARTYHAEVARRVPGAVLAGRLPELLEGGRPPADAAGGEVTMVGGSLYLVGELLALREGTAPDPGEATTEVAAAAP